MNYETCEAGFIVALDEPCSRCGRKSDQFCGKAPADHSGAKILQLQKELDDKNDLIRKRNELPALLSERDIDWVIGSTDDGYGDRIYRACRAVEELVRAKFAEHLRLFEEQHKEQR